MTDRHGEGPIVRKAIDTVRALPQVDDAAVQRIVAAAAQAREHDVEPQADDLPAAPGIGVRELRLRLTHGARRRRIGVTALAAVAAAAVIASMLIGSPPWRTAMPQSTAAAPPAQAAPEAAPVLPVAAAAHADDAVAIPTQFVLENRAAHRVLLVGDFSGWGTHAIPLVREGTSSLWEATVPLPPGRHVYAFLVDSVWTTDPRAPAARDPDFGVTGSVVIVGKP